MRIQPLIKECRSVQTGTSLKVNFQILIGMCKEGGDTLSYEAH